jgi:hypothetical protein
MVTPRGSALVWTQCARPGGRSRGPANPIRRPGSSLITSLADAAPSAGALSGREPFAELRDNREFRKEAGRNRLA